MKRPKSQSDDIYEECNEEYVSYGKEYAKYITTKYVKIDETRDEKDDKESEEVYEEYRDIILKFAKRKWITLSVIALLAICGLVVGVSVHFTKAQGFFTSTSRTVWL